MFSVFQLFQKILFKTLDVLVQQNMWFTQQLKHGKIQVSINR